MAATRGLLLASNRNMLVEYGGHVKINKAWVQSFLERMDYVKRKATASKSKYSLTDFKQVKKQFLKEVAEIVVMEEIPPELGPYRIECCTSFSLDHGQTRKKKSGNDWTER